MPTLTKSLKEKIHQLKSAIDSQQQELAAYKLVLQIETKNEKPVVPAAAPVAEPSPSPKSDVSYSGNKTALIVDIVQSYGSTGATSKEIGFAFASRNIPVGSNFIYSTLGFLLSKKRLVRRDGKYFAAAKSAAIAPSSKPSVSPAKKQTPKTKGHISPEGIEKIRKAAKKRWAAKRAADRKAA
jgi:hypothetical protein